jgi:tetratricopeptide (TPR) repeat protein
MKTCESCEYGNVSFGEATKILVDTIGQDAILSVIPQKEHQAYKRKLERMYKGKMRYFGLSVEDPESLQDYFAKFFEELEKKYNLSHNVMVIVDSVTWQLFYALKTFFPCELSKKESALYLLRRQVFSMLTDSKKHPFIKRDTVLCLISDDYKKIFDDLADKITKGNQDKLASEIQDYYNHTPNCKETDNFQQTIARWRNGSVATPSWRLLKYVLDFASFKKQNNIVHRLVGLYLLKNGMKALEEVCHISSEEQESILRDIVSLFIEQKPPEYYYGDDNEKDFPQILLINECIRLMHEQSIDSSDLENRIQELEQACPHCKSFFSSWFRARKSILNDRSANTDPEKVIQLYREAFNKGINYAGGYLDQFLLEAIAVNRYFIPQKKKDWNDYSGYLDAFRMYTKEHECVLNFLKKIEQVEIDDQLLLITQEYNPFALISSRVDILNESIRINNQGLEYHNSGEYTKAIEYYTNAIILNPNYANAYSNRANTYGAMKQYDLVIEDNGKAIEINPRHLNALLNRALLYFNMHNYEKSIEDVSRLLAISPEDYEAYSLRGNTYLHK